MCVTRDTNSMVSTHQAIDHTKQISHKNNNGTVCTVLWFIESGEEDKSKYNGFM